MKSDQKPREFFGEVQDMVRALRYETELWSYHAGLVDEDVTETAAVMLETCGIELSVSDVQRFIRTGNFIPLKVWQ